MGKNVGLSAGQHAALVQLMPALNGHEPHISTNAVDTLDGFRTVLRSQAQTFFRRYYRQHGRSFPWREPRTSPFGILVAELLLRQTRAEQVAAIWPELLERYPTSKELAAANPEELYVLLAPLGLGRQRVEAITTACSALVSRHRGSIPRSVEKLSDLPHVGIYAAHAVACFAFGQRVAVVDGNVLRVLGRLFGEEYGKDNRRTSLAWERAQSLIPEKGSVKEHNYGLLDFAASICKSGPPLCQDCRLNGLCTWCEVNVWAKRDRLPNGQPGPPLWPNKTLTNPSLG